MDLRAGSHTALTPSLVNDSIVELKETAYTIKAKAESRAEEWCVERPCSGNQARYQQRSIGLLSGSERSCLVDYPVESRPGHLPSLASSLPGGTSEWSVLVLSKAKESSSTDPSRCPRRKSSRTSLAFHTP